MARDNRKFAASTDWPKGCSPPDGYIAWHSWAEAQHKHGLRQKQCAAAGAAGTWKCDVGHTTTRAGRVDWHH